MECKRAQNLLDAYFDEELDPLHAMEVEAHVQECGRCAAVLKGRKALQQALRSQLPYYRAPELLRRKIPGNTPRPWRRLALAMAACLVLLLGALSWSILMHASGHTVDPSIQLADAVESDHVRSLLNPDHLTDVLSTDKHTVKPWFAGKLPFAPPVLDLDSDGPLPLVGGTALTSSIIKHSSPPWCIRKTSTSSTSLSGLQEARRSPFSGRLYHAARLSHHPLDSRWHGVLGRFGR